MTKCVRDPTCAGTREECYLARPNKAFFAQFCRTCKGYILGTLREFKFKLHDNEEVSLVSLFDNFDKPDEI